jgi:hypothetical protein
LGIVSRSTIVPLDDRCFARIDAIS